MKNLRIYTGSRGLNLGVRAENLPEYSQIAIYRSPKTFHITCLAFGQKRQKFKMDASGYLKKSFSTNNPIFKCHISFLDDFRPWNPFQAEGQNMVPSSYSKINFYPTPSLYVDFS